MLRNFHQMRKCLSQWHILTMRKVRRRQKMRLKRMNSGRRMKQTEKQTVVSENSGNDELLERIIELLGQMITRDLIQDKRVTEKHRDQTKRRKEFKKRRVTTAWASPSSVSTRHSFMDLGTTIPKSPNRKSLRYSSSHSQSSPRPSTALTVRDFFRGERTGTTVRSAKSNKSRKAPVVGRPVLSAGPYKPTSDPELVPVPRDLARSPAKPFVGGTGTHSHSKIVAEQRKFRDRVKYTPRSMNTHHSPNPDNMSELVQTQLVTLVKSIKKQILGLQ